MNIPPPPPTRWAPRTRRVLDGVFAWLDRRKAAKYAATNQYLADQAWRNAYDLWFYEHGWAQGAPNTADAYAIICRNRHATAAGYHFGQRATP